jgi:hypothetical protein
LIQTGCLNLTNGVQLPLILSSNLKMARLLWMKSSMRLAVLVRSRQQPLKDNCLTTFLCFSGIKVTEDQVKSDVAAFLASEPHNTKFVEDRYRYLGIALGAIKNFPSLKWADGGLVKSELEKQVEEKIGKRDERDVPQKKKGKKVTAIVLIIIIC